MASRKAKKPPALSSAERLERHRARGKPVGLTIMHPEAIEEFERLTDEMGSQRLALEFALLLSAADSKAT